MSKLERYEDGKCFQADSVHDGNQRAGFRNEHQQGKAHEQGEQHYGSQERQRLGRRTAQ